MVLPFISELDLAGRKELIQDVPSGCFLGYVDIKTKVGFHYMILVLKRNFCFTVNYT